MISKQCKCQAKGVERKEKDWEMAGQKQCTGQCGWVWCGQ